jgi:hypothetical protein
MKSPIFWDIMPCSSFKACFLPASCWFLASFILQPRRWRQHVPPKRRLTINGLHGVISQKKALLIHHYLYSRQLNQAFSDISSACADCTINQSSSTIGPHRRSFFLLLFISQVAKALLFKSIGHLTSCFASHSVNFAIVAADLGAWCRWAEYPLRRGTLQTSHHEKRDNIQV